METLWRSSYLIEKGQYLHLLSQKKSCPRDSERYVHAHTAVCAQQVCVTSFYHKSSSSLEHPGLETRHSETFKHKTMTTTRQNQQQCAAGEPILTLGYPTEFRSQVLSGIRWTTVGEMNLILATTTTSAALLLVPMRTRRFFPFTWTRHSTFRLWLCRLSLSWHVQRWHVPSGVCRVHSTRANSPPPRNHRWEERTPGIHSSSVYT